MTTAHPDTQHADNATAILTEDDGVLLKVKKMKTIPTQIHGWRI